MTLTGAGRRSRPAVAWASFVALVLFVLLLCSAADSLEPDGAAGAAALRTTQALQGDGVRVVGSDNLQRALDRLADELGQIDRVEVTRQREVSGVVRAAWYDVWYRTSNVIAVLPGENPDALLVNVHVDSPPESVGASDDAVAVGSALEALRRLSLDPPEQTVIFLFNGGEEVGFAGADAFTRLPMAADVRWFLNLEALGAGGRALLADTGPDSGELTARVGRTDRPYGSTVGRDLLASGLLGSATDSTVWKRQGWQGLDYSTIDDGYVYHTPLDRVSRIPDGTAEAMADLVVATATHIGDDPPQPSPDVAYADVLTRAWVAVPFTVGLVVSLGGLVAAVGLAGLDVRAGHTRLRDVLWGAAGAVAAVLGGVVGAAVTGLVLWLLGASHAWYANPWLLAVTFAPGTVLGLAAGAAWLLRAPCRGHGDDRRADQGVQLSLAVAVLVGSASTAVLEVGSGLVLWALGPIAVLMVAASRLTSVAARRLCLTVLAAAAVVPLILAVDTLRRLLVVLVPLMGRSDFGIPGDVALGIGFGVAALPLVLMAAWLGVRTGGWRLVAGTAVTVLVTGVIASAVSSPFSATRPLVVEVREDQVDGETSIVLEASSGVPADDLTATAAGRTGLAQIGDRLRAQRTEVPRASVKLSRSDRRTTQLRLGSNAATMIYVVVTGSRVDSIGGRTFDSSQAAFDVINHPQGFAADIVADGPVTVEVRQVFATTTPELAAVAGALPSHVVSTTRIVHHTEIKR